MKTINLARLGAASILAAIVGGVVARAIAPEWEMSSAVASDWTRIVLVAASGFVALFFVARDVRGARLLWLTWLLAAFDFTREDVAAVSQSAFSVLAFAFYAAFGVQVIVAILLFLPSSSGDDPAKTPNKAPEPTPTSVMPRATSRDSERNSRTELQNPARVMPAAVVAHL